MTEKQRKMRLNLSSFMFFTCIIFSVRVRGYTPWGVMHTVVRYLASFVVYDRRIANIQFLAELMICRTDVRMIYTRCASDDMPHGCADDIPPEGG